MEQTRSRPYRKNDQATVESRNNHVVRKHAFYYRYEPPELDLLNELWELVSIKMNLFTPSKKPIGRSCTRDGRPRRVYTGPRPRGRGSNDLTNGDRADGGAGQTLNDNAKPHKTTEFQRSIAPNVASQLLRSNFGPFRSNLAPSSSNHQHGPTQNGGIPTIHNPAHQPGTTSE